VKKRRLRGIKPTAETKASCNKAKNKSKKRLFIYRGVAVEAARIHLGRATKQNQITIKQQSTKKASIIESMKTTREEAKYLENRELFVVFGQMESHFRQRSFFRNQKKSKLVLQTLLT
jgi:hypothetical protein